MSEIATYHQQCRDAPCGLRPQSVPSGPRHTFRLAEHASKTSPFFSITTASCRKGVATAGRLPGLLGAELLTGNGRQERHDVALDSDFARFLDLNYEVVLELAAAEGLVAQMEDEHFILGAA